MKERHPYRVYSNVSEREYALLQQICKDYGFNSIYALLQALLRTLLRYANTQSYQEEDEGIGAEVEEMFNDFLDWENDPRSSRKNVR